MGNQTEKAPKVIGIGGIFFKSDSPENMRKWYSEKLGLVTNEYGSLFEFRDSDNPDKKGYLQWSPFEKNTVYFAPCEKEYMINYRVQNLEKLIDNLRADGVQIVGEIETFDYGKFAHVIDPEGNKLEFWEPIDEVFTELYEDKTTK